MLNERYKENNKELVLLQVITSKMPILNRLNGRKILIMGNHDFKNKDYYAFEHGFEYVTQQIEISIEHRKVILNHFPMLCYGGTYRKDEDKVYQLFGHVHSGPNSDSGLDIKRLVNLFPTQYDVGVHHIVTGKQIGRAHV